jgi:hypothetical protein
VRERTQAEGIERDISSAALPALKMGVPRRALIPHTRLLSSHPRLAGGEMCGKSFAVETLEDRGPCFVNASTGAAEIAGYLIRALCHLSDPYRR